MRALLMSAGEAPVLTTGSPDYNSSTDWLDENPQGTRTAGPGDKSTRLKQEM